MNELYGRVGAFLGATTLLVAMIPSSGTSSASPVASRSGAHASAPMSLNEAPTWLTAAVHRAYITASDGAAFDYFGVSVAVSGNTAVVGASGDTTQAGYGAGSAYVFVRSAGTTIEQAHLFASDGEATDNFGWSVGLSRDTAVVGAPDDDTSAGEDAGSAYVFWR